MRLQNDPSEKQRKTEVGPTHGLATPLRQGATSAEEALRLRELRAQQISNEQRQAHRDTKLAENRIRWSEAKPFVTRPSNSEVHANRRSLFRLQKRMIQLRIKSKISAARFTSFIP